MLLIQAAAIKCARGIAEAGLLQSPWFGLSARPACAGRWPRNGQDARRIGNGGVARRGGVDRDGG
jgi:hypothetical protein